jgi:hypothetical protein
MRHVRLPSDGTAAWSAAIDGDFTAGLGANVPPQLPATGPCRHSLRRQAPRVGWGVCRHAGGGLFCQLDSEVVFFINKLRQVVSFDKILFF